MLKFLATKRFWKRLAITCGLLIALLVIADLFMVWLVEHKLQTKLAEIRTAGDPASIADLAPEPIPADQNAAAILERVAPQLKAFGKDQWAFGDSPIGEAFNQAEERGAPPSLKQVEAIRRIIDKYPQIDEALAEAAACDQYASRMDFSLGPNELLDDMIEQGQTIRTMARFEDWRMLVLSVDGQREEAVRHGVELLKLVRLHDAEPLLINYLIGIAVRSIAAQGLYDTLAAGPIPPQLHKEIDDELAKHDDPHRLVRTLKTERAYSAALTASISQDAALDGVNPLWMSLVGWPMKWMYVGALDSFDRLIPLSTQPWDEVCRELGSPHSAAPPTGDGVLADLLLPAMKVTYEANNRDLATLRALRIFNALTLYRDEHGREATGLGDLSLPEEAMIDPFNGQPLKLKHTDDGWIVYTVMTNGVDDDGDFKKQKDWGVAPRGHRGN